MSAIILLDYIVLMFVCFLFKHANRLINIGKTGKSASTHVKKVILLHGPCTTKPCECSIK